MAAAQYSVEVGPASNPNETAPRRATIAKDKPLVLPPGYSKDIDNIYDFIRVSCEKQPNNNALAYREIIDIIEEKKIIEKNNKKIEKLWSYYQLSDYKNINYKQLLKNINNIGFGLVNLGLKPKSDTDKVHIYAATSHKWFQLFLGCQSQTIPIVTAYDTLGESGLIHSLIQTDSKAIFTDNSLLPSLINPLKNDKVNLKYLIYNERLNSSDKRDNGKLYKNAKDALDKIKEIRPDLKILSFDDLLEDGSKNINNLNINKPSADDLACIMYTSGSTGDPKGVVLSHKNIISGVSGITYNVAGIVSNKDRLICFLPLAHILEMVFELLCMCWGACIGYATVKTLSSNSVRNCKGDMQAFKPTIMCGVPAVWESIKKGVLAQVDQLPSFKRKIFWSAYYSKKFLKNSSIPGGDTIGNLVFSKLKEATGGELRYMVNGGSPVSKDCQTLLTHLICPMLVGYGLTETCASTTLVYPQHFTTGVAGDLTACVTVKLRDCDELNYLAKNNQGEILIKGDNIIKEYFKNPKETKAAFTDDGWFCTGDVGEWQPNGQIKIIDRIKNLVKTQNGEYVALEKLESIYRSSKYVSNICVYADETKVKPVAIVVPNTPVVFKLAIEKGIMKKEDEHVDHIIKELDNNREFVDTILQEMLEDGKKQGLKGIELLQGIVLFDGDWTPQNGFVTSAAKLQRRVILQSVKNEVNRIYSESS